MWLTFLPVYAIWESMIVCRSQCFFFTRENEKCPRKRFLVLFLVFFSGGNFFLAHFFFNFSRAVWSFLGHIFVFFLGMNFFLSRAEIKNFLAIFLNLTGKILIFFLGQRFFFLGLNLAVFFSGTIFFSRAVFQIFSRPVWKLLGQNIENFLGFNFFFSGKKINNAPFPGKPRLLMWRDYM